MVTMTSISPSPSSFQPSDPLHPSLQHSTSGRILSMAVGAGATHIYAGSYAGVWRSDDLGQHWKQLIGPPTDAVGPDVASGIYAPRIFDLAASPVDPNLVLAAASGGQFVVSRNGIYRSANSGFSWALVLPQFFVNEIVFAPDDPSLIYAALGNAVAISHDAGRNWEIILLAGAQHLAVGPQESGGIRRVYAAGGNLIAYSLDGGNHWDFDPGIGSLIAARNAVSDFRVACQTAKGQEPSRLPSFSGGTAEAVGSGAHILAIEPGNPARIYLAARGGANGPSYYNHQDTPPDGTLCHSTCDRLANEASLWLGDFSQVGTTGMAQWTQLPGPPVYSGVSTPSGNTFVLAKPVRDGFLLFFADNSHVHVSKGTPSAASWHRLDGKDVSAVKLAGEHGNKLFVHVDPHAIVCTADFEITLKAPSGVTFPYDQNQVLDQHLGGTLWMANDGGVYGSNDGGQSWQPSTGLETLDAINIAGLFGRGDAPALYFGCGDNDDFFSRDGGNTWQDPITSCGDCDAWFTDTAQPSRVLELTPRSDVNGIDGSVNIITSSNPFSYPDASDPAQNHFIPAPRRVKQPNEKMPPYPVSDLVLRGYRPVIRTLATESPKPDGDYVFFHSSDGVSRKLLRTTSISSITQLSDWDDPGKAQPIGTALPGNPTLTEPIVQVSGGHANPVFFVGDGMGKLFKLEDPAGTWQAIVPGGPPGRSASFAKRFFVDPFHPEIIYLVDTSGIKVSIDGGESWLPEVGLTKAVTADGKISSLSNTVITDMLFLRGESKTRFVFGDAGVFATLDGILWFTVLDALAIPGKPESGFFDPISDPEDRVLYVTLEGRSVVRLSGIPGPPPFEAEPPPLVVDLLELAALLEA